MSEKKNPRHFKTFEQWSEDKGSVIAENGPGDEGSNGENDATYFAIEMKSDKGTFEFLAHKDSFTEDGVNVVERESGSEGFIKKDELDTYGTVTGLEENSEVFNEAVRVLSEKEDKKKGDSSDGDGDDDPKKIDNKDEFMDFVKKMMEKAHGDDYDESKAEKMANDLLEKSREKGWSWSELVGVVQNSVGS